MNALPKDRVQYFVKAYNANPAVFDEKMASSLKEQAAHHKLPFALTDEHHKQTLSSIAGQAIKGYVSGISTIPWDDGGPQGGFETVARRVGNLAGFMGLLPVPDVVEKGAARGFMGSLKGIKLATGNSIPMKGASFIQKHVNKKLGTAMSLANADSRLAGSTVMKFLNNDYTKDFAQGMFHLGTASAISSWHGGIDEMLNSFKHGAITGGAFRAIGNLRLTGNPMGDKAIRVLSSSMYTGLPSTYRDETTPEQVYSYLEGAMFGFFEKPAPERRSMQFSQEALKKYFEKRDPEFRDISKHEGYDLLSPETQSLAKKSFDRAIEFVDIEALAAEVGYSVERAEKMRSELEQMQTDELGNKVRELEAEEQAAFQEAKKKYTTESSSLSFEDSDYTPPQIVDVRMESLVRSYLPNSTKGEVVVKAVELRDRFTERLVEGDKEAYAKTITDVEKSLGVSLSERERGGFRIQQKRFEQDYNVQMVNFTNGKFTKLPLGKARNAVGNDKSMRLPKPPIVQVFEAAAEKAGVKTEGQALVVLDHFIEGGKEYSLGEEISFKGSDPVEKQVATRIKNATKQLQKEGYYYFGGRGDAERAYFMKFHPEASKLTDADVTGQLDNSLRILGINPSVFKKTMVEWSKEVGGGDAHYKRATLSNIHYMLEQNGMPISRESLAVIGERDENNEFVHDFLRDGKAWNKRLQIMLNTGYGADPDFAALRKEFPAGVISLQLRGDAEGRNLKYDSPASAFPEGTDGILTLTPKAIKALNMDAGIPVEGRDYGGANKSFIYDFGANGKGMLLGKYMIHEATPGEIAGFKEGQHGIIHTSATKQLGTRKVGDIIDFPVDAIKTVFSEVTDSHSIAPARVAKQVLSNLTQYANGAIRKEAIQEMLKSIYSRGTLGTEEGKLLGTKIVNRINTLEKTSTSETKDFIENLDDVPILDVLKVLRESSDHALVSKIYDKILRIEREDAIQDRASGEITDKELVDKIEEMDSFDTLVNRLMKVGEDLPSIMTHKYVKEYREQAVHNYVMTRAVKPKLKNSGAFRMRPFTKEQAAESPRIAELENNPDIFFLDKGAREMPIHVDFMKKKTTLGALWDKYEGGFFDKNSEQKTMVEEVFRAATYRVPMDSLSGLQVLNFAGFTERNGYGVLIHPRVMRALSGSDLDGDKAFVFFGDEANGFKKNWKDMYESNQEEFFDFKYTKGGEKRFSGMKELVKEAMREDIIFDFSKESMKSVDGTREVAAKHVNVHGNHIIRLNVPELRRLWKEKAWTKPKLAGVQPLEEAAFKTFEEWMTFVSLHEMHHVGQKRNRGRVKRENEANRKALADMGIRTDATIKNTKKIYSEELSPKDAAFKKIQEVVSDKSNMLGITPLGRMYASRGAMIGRKALGGNVTLRSTMIAQHSHLVEMQKGGADLQPTPVHFGKNQNAILSNFAETPFVFRGKKFLTAEGAYQAYKTGRYIKGFERLRGFDSQKKGRSLTVNKKTNEALMREVLKAKHTQVPQFAKALAESGEITHPVQDSFWRKAFPEMLTELKPKGAERGRLSPLYRIISGGQVGADMEGLQAARALRLKTGGTAPPNFEMKDGFNRTTQNPKLLKSFGLKAGAADPTVWKKRTLANVQNSDGTILFGNTKSPGSRLTSQYANKENRPLLENPTGKELRNWILENDIKTVNIAGNRVLPNGEGSVRRFLIKELSKEMFASHSYKKTTAGVYIGTDANGASYTIKATTDAKRLQRFRELSRAAIERAADPMDEAGIISYKELQLKLADALFDYTRNGKTVKAKDVEEKNKKTGELIRDKHLAPFRNINSLLYGRNRATGKRWSALEVKSGLNRAAEALRGKGAVEPTTMLDTLIGMVGKLDYHDSILKRVDADIIRRLDGEHAKLVGTPEYRALQKVLGRSNMQSALFGKSEKKTDMREVIEQKLYEAVNFERETSEPTASIDLFSGVKNKRGKLVTDFIAPDSGKGWLNRRKEHIMEAIRKAEAMLSNDLATKASIEHNLETSKEVRNRFKEDVKDSTHSGSKRVKEIAEDVASLKDLIAKYHNIFKDAKKKSDKPLSRIPTQAAIDARIRSIKATYATVPEQKLFDSLLMGSLSTTRMGYKHALRLEKEHGEEIEKAGPKDLISIKVGGQKGDLTKEELVTAIAKAKERSASTSYTKFGLESPFISESSLRRHLELYDSQFRKASGESAKIQDAMLKESKKGEKATEPAVPKKLILGDREVNGDLLESSEYLTTAQKYIDDFAPFIKVNEGKSTPEMNTEVVKLREHLNFYGSTIKKNLHMLTKGLLNVDLNAMTLTDFQKLNRWFTITRNGSWFGRMMNRFGKKDGKGVRGWFYNAFPESVGREQMKTEIQVLRKKGAWYTADGQLISGNVAIPTSRMNILQEGIAHASEMGTKVYETMAKELQDEGYAFIQNAEQGLPLFRIAIGRGEYEGAKKSYTADADFPKVDIVREKMNRAMKDGNWEALKKQSFMLGDKQLTGEQVVERIEKIYFEKWAPKMHKIMTGDKTFLDQFNHKDKDGNTLYHAFGPDSGKHRGEFLNENLPQVNIKKFLKFVADARAEGRELPLEIGLDGLAKISRSLMVQQLLAKGKMNEAEQLVLMVKGVEGTGFIPGYFPHEAVSGTKAVQKSLEAKRNAILKEPLSKDPKVAAKEIKERARRLNTLHFNMRKNAGDISLETIDADLWDNFNAIMEGKVEGSAEKISWTESMVRNRHQMTRSLSLEDWIVSPEAYERYINSVVTSFYKTVGHIEARHELAEAYKDNVQRLGTRQAMAWDKYYKMYVNGAMGNPDIIPEEYMRDKDLNLKGTPYAWFNDLRMQKSLDKMLKKVGWKKELPKEFRNLKGLEMLDVRQIISLSNMEAKYQLATLLSHPKTGFANLLGGELHTAIQTGFRPLTQAMSLKHLRTLNPEWKTMEDVERYVRESGIVEEYLLQEMNQNPIMSKARNSGFKTDLLALAKKGELNSKEVRALASKYGLLDKVFEGAAWFMRASERKLRTHSYLAHLLQAKAKWGDALPYNHPLLTQIAKRGVRATQFMYSAPYRPMFARTAMGKVLTRFQMFAWNSVKLRNDITRDARIAGFRPGTEEFERYKRLALADMVSFGLANAFHYSLFENNLPQPLAWIQDWSEWMFGADDTELERAFFGAYPKEVAPLQMITPPALRMVGPLIKSMITDDWSRIANYHTWMLFPFGRIGRDVIGPNNLFENPFRAVEKVSGLPYLQASRRFLKLKEEKTWHVGGI